ncbi:LOG family protein [Leptospira sp. GIMC2001]|uniref:LOG family protein n=1 Tax=Leptospira sp. GIMC2001 TaxID=1513297 RepID=UPI00234BF902|nr:LOG family protein [Leptospira sp. GIMC2001]WCL48667.1 LOG family protein [Leptospira sp. GIMC2001]
MTQVSFENLEFINSDPAFPIRILSEWIYPKIQLEKQRITDTIVLFGSARIPSRENWQKEFAEAQESGNTSKIQKLENKAALIQSYEDAREFANQITKWGNVLSNGSAEHKLVVCTGGGPGIMEAGNRGAKEAGGLSLAFNISLPYEQETNAFANPDMSFSFRYFFMRKYWFVKMCRGLVAFPGGFGTLDEVFETLTLIQTKKRDKIPVVLYNSEFWRSVINFPYLVKNGLIEEEDLKLFHFSDTVDDAVGFLKENIQF